MYAHKYCKFTIYVIYTILFIICYIQMRSITTVRTTTAIKQIP